MPILDVTAGQFFGTENLPDRWIKCDECQASMPCGEALVGGDHGDLLFCPRCRQPGMTMIERPPKALQ